MKKTLKKLKNTKGVSLVEMLVCVLLFTIAFMAGIQGLVFAFGSTQAVEKEANAEKVGDIILNRVEGEVANMAQEGKFYITENGDAVEFTSASGIPIYICNDGGYLLIHYWSTNTSESANGKTIAASDWTFAEGVYRGYTILDLKFTTGNHNGKLTVKAILNLESDTGKQFTFQRTVCAYNRKDAEVDSKYATLDDMKAENPTGAGTD